MPTVYSISLPPYMNHELPSNANYAQSANYVRTELPVRIAHRLRDLQTLPYVVVTQEGVARVYEVRQRIIYSNAVLY